MSNRTLRNLRWYYHGDSLYLLGLYALFALMGNLTTSEVNRPLATIADRQLIIRTEVAPISLDGPVLVEQSDSKKGDITYRCYVWPAVYRALSSKNNNNAVFSEERPIKDPATNTPGTHVGLVKILDESQLSSAYTRPVEAMIMSEAQYLGDEKSIDLLGYTLYNIMVIRRRPDGVVERIWLGKMRKSAWKTARPKPEVIILE
ncbi:hypothetical protein H2200_000442 [Cladophialophora chaetospira]|uniref:Uncharacterized protein n=1 Tax=Cladophialophora chaetospira TaxID=386627 RepID=A0AA38XNE8_9EURO|nr:hypothetical protein H2200_000442 [Cladophialophora chaetospira]